MTIYVDELEAYGWILRGKKVESCHMFSDEIDLSELHVIAGRIGMQKRWFQDKPSCPHYDLIESKRNAAIAAGAIPVNREEGCRLRAVRRDLLRASRR